MAAKTYGQTWWGKQWLNALVDIDDENRLPRGRTYANKGAVMSFALDGGEIRAKVQGSRPSPYKIVIRIPAMAPKDAQTLIAALAEDYGVVAGLLNRELSPVVLEVAERLGIKVFPARWKDINMDCSCPDWANPCKHLAATIYVLTREIDADPFIVFTLRGVDLAAALRGRNVPSESRDDAPPSLDALMTAEGEATESVYLTDAEPPDFAALRDLSETLPRLLPASPIFYHHGDFREFYAATLKRVGKEARQLLKSPFSTEGHAFSGEDRPHFSIGEYYDTQITGFPPLPHRQTAYGIVGYIRPEELDRYQPETAALHYLYVTALELLARGAIMPEIFTDGGGTTHIRWIPATLDAGVADAMRRLSALLPPGMASYGKKQRPLPPKAQATALCSLFLDHFVRRYTAVPKKQSDDTDVYRLFFSRGYAQLHAPGERHIPASIRLWTSRLRIAEVRYLPVVCLEDVGDDFALALGVEGGDRPFTLLSHVLSAKEWADDKFDILKTVTLLTEFFPPLHGYISDRARTPVRIAARDLPAFLFDALPVMRLLGIRAVLPKGLERMLRPRASMAMKKKDDASPHALNLRDMLDFRWKVAVGDHMLTQEEFEKLVKGATGIIRLRDEYVFLDPSEIDALRKQLQKPPKLSAVDLLHAALAEEYAGAAVFLDDDVRAMIRELTEIGEVAPPAGLRANLRPYQHRGFSWLYRNAAIGLGSVLADDMGLGKTLQVIAALLKLKEEGRLKDGALVAVPSSLLTNWRKEIERFAPGLSVAVYHGAARELKGDRPDVVLTTYGLVRSEAERFRNMQWDVVVADEAQNLKNPAALQTKALKTLHARRFVAMSGTPVENRLSEYWSVVDFAHRGYLGPLAGFVKNVADPIRIHRDMRVVERFRKITAPVLMRRLKSDKSVIADLPDKIERNQFCELTKKQAATYESVLRKAMKTIEGEEDGFSRQGLVLQMILALKQICNHPFQYTKQGKRDAELSGKGVRYLELLEEIYDAGEKTLVFTQFTEMGELLVDWAKERFGKAPLFLHGGLARSKRDELVDRFQNNRTDRVFVLSLKAGGTGLNLTAASNVVHYDLWWNPAVEAQATDRAYRIGQTKNVQVHRFITRATFEERIDEMIRSKRELADLTVGTGENWIGHLSNAELKEAFSLKEAA